ncbi:hypothetical protein C8F01DRAFT_616078 [Mycena amicta]|nr:hypothetical protein C8F01DRAFT_616078 [Mycena amicta]
MGVPWFSSFPGIAPWAFRGSLYFPVSLHGRSVGLSTFRYRFMGVPWFSPLPGIASLAFRSSQTGFRCIVPERSDIRRQYKETVLRTCTSLRMKSTVALFVTLAMAIAAVSGLAVDPQNKRDGVFGIYPSLTAHADAAPTKEARVNTHGAHASVS